MSRFGRGWARASRSCGTPSTASTTTGQVEEREAVAVDQHCRCLREHRGDTEDVLHRAAAEQPGGADGDDGDHSENGHVAHATRTPTRRAGMPAQISPSPVDESSTALAPTTVPSATTSSSPARNKHLRPGADGHVVADHDPTTLGDRAIGHVRVRQSDHHAGQDRDSRPDARRAVHDQPDRAVGELDGSGPLEPSAGTRRRAA